MIAFLGGVAVTACVATIATAPVAGAQNAKLGKEIWVTKVNCRDCHGWSGDGVPDNPQAHDGPSLRETKLDPEHIAETIRCGRPGTPMPHFDRLAYSDDRCYGLTAADLGDETPPAAQASLIKREVDALVAYLQEAVIGKGAPTFEQCVELWGEQSTRCGRYPKAN